MIEILPPLQSPDEYNFFYEYIILIPFLAYIITSFIKGSIHAIKTEKIDFERFVGSGGMPSVHSAIIISMTVAVLLKHGINSDIFWVCLTLAVIIIYDAVNVRYEAGLHAEEINKVIGEKKFKESLGHSPLEAMAGSVLWALIAFLLFII